MNYLRFRRRVVQVLALGLWLALPYGDATALAADDVGARPLTRNDKLDLVIQSDGNELAGTIANDKFVLDSLVGKLELPAAKVLGLAVPSDDDPYVQIELVDGQVVAGKLGAPLTFKLEDGNVQTFGPDKLNFKSASFRVSKERPREIPFGGPFLVLRGGQRLAFEAAGLSTAVLRSVYGDIKIDPAQVASVATDASDGALDRVTFRNGSVVSGLLSPDKFTLKLALGMPLEIGLPRIARFEFSPTQGDLSSVSPHIIQRMTDAGIVGGSAGDLCQILLRNEDAIVGKLTDQAIDLQTQNGKIAIKPTDIATLEFGDEDLGQVEVKLNTGLAYNGRILNRSLKFKIEPGPEISLPVGMLQSLGKRPVQKYDWRIADISRLLNRPLADEVDNDGKGGWTDQGPTADLRNLQAGDCKFNGVPFRVESGNACFIMKNKHRPSENLPASGRVDLKGQADMLAFLHSGGWIETNVKQATYVINYADGTKVEIPVIGGKNILDWVGPTDAADAIKYDPALGLILPAVNVACPQFGRATVWMVLWKNPHPEKPIASLEVIGANEGIPGLIGVSMGVAK
jgi:hypothetical protein